MPGRQSHGRTLLSGPDQSGSKGKKRSKTKSSKKAALNAYAIAEEEYGERTKLTPRNRELDAELGSSHARGGKYARGEEDDEEDDEDEDEGPPRKIRRGAQDNERDGDGVEYGSDSSGNEWRVGVDEDDDSEIDSDEAFGESDEERFQGYTFRGSKKKQAGEDDEEDDDDIDDVDGASLGSDAIDLADALDQSSSDDDEQPHPNEDENASEEGASEDDSSSSGDESSDVEASEADDVSESGVNDWVAQFSGVKNTEKEEAATGTKPKLSLKDLGLTGVKDPELRKSLKLLKKEEKSSKPRKLQVPLARRQQAQLDRVAAYEKTNQTLDRWTETVKHNRRADHVVFPLPQNQTGLTRHDNSEIMPLNQKSAGTELEQTILAIMEESGLGPSTKKDNRDDNDEDAVDDGGISRGDRMASWQQKRQEREFRSREDARAKRIKRIKSKAYHRVHRRKRERAELKEREVMEAAGEINSEEEREAQDRQRATERMGGRHRNSKWAKMSSKGGRAAWDEDVRVGLQDMVRRDEELRRRVEGKPSGTNGDDDDDSDYSGDSEDVDDKQRLLRKLDEVSAIEDGEPKSKLMEMPFMQKAEAVKKKANDELVAQMRKDLGSEDEDEGDSESGPDDIGRRKYGLPPNKKTGKSAQKLAKADKRNIVKKADVDAISTDVAIPIAGRSRVLSAPAPQSQTANTTVGAWSQPGAASALRKSRKGQKTGSGTDVLELDSNSIAVAPQAAPTKAPKLPRKQVVVATGDGYSSDDDEDNLPIQFRDQDLIERAFGGLDVVAEFQKEKADLEEDEGDKVIDDTLPGWGSWVGHGVSNRDKKRHQGRFLTKQEGVQKQDRKDAKLRNVVISEKRVKKNDQYLASQLPFPFESKLQYERSLRLPVGPEWVTKETFQEATKPRVLIKQGIIAPISKPTH